LAGLGERRLAALFSLHLGHYVGEAHLSLNRPEPPSGTPNLSPKPVPKKDICDEGLGASFNRITLVRDRLRPGVVLLADEQPLTCGEPLFTCSDSAISHLLSHLVLSSWS
jgi:hypothetical protein